MRLRSSSSVNFFWKCCLNKKICIIIPCYNEASRLPVDKIVEFSHLYDFVLVDDGSKDQTASIITRIQSDSIHPLILKKNVGKAEAIRAGFTYVLESSHFDKCEWVGYLDADLATPLEEVASMFKFQEFFYPLARSLWGSRWSRLGSDIDRKQSRHYSGRAFATVAYLITGIPTYDSQCGAKFFQKPFVHEISKEPFCTKWLFDIEIYFRLKRVFGSDESKIIEYPLKVWVDVEGSKVNMLEMLFKTFPQLLRIRRKYVSNGRS